VFLAQEQIEIRFCPELHSFHRLSQSGRCTSHMHSLNALIGRDFLFRARLSKMKSPRRCRSIARDGPAALSTRGFRAGNPPHRLPSSSAAENIDLCSQLRFQPYVWVSGCFLARFLDTVHLIPRGLAVHGLFSSCFHSSIEAQSCFWFRFSIPPELRIRMCYSGIPKVVPCALP
jgi:hypothetical protein